MPRQPHAKRHHYPVAPFVSPLVAQFFTLLGDSGIALTDCAESAKLSVACVVKWKRRHVPVLTKFESALAALGYELQIIKKGERI